MNAPENLVISRHAQSFHNWAKQEVIVSQTETRHTDEFEASLGRKIELTDLGHEQAVALGGLVKGLGITFDAFFVSPATRALQTAKGMDLPGAEWQITRQIRERDYGIIDTMAPSKYVSEFPRNAQLREQDPLYWRPPSGESIVEVVDRIGAFTRMLHEEYAGANIFVLSHGDFMWASMCSLESLSDDEWEARYRDEDFRIRNTSTLHYSRRNPHTDSIDPVINWVRRLHPIDAPDAPWEHLRPPTFTNEELPT